MPLQQLAKTQWQTYFDRIAKELGTKRVEIEVTGLGLGDQVAADWLPLVGVSYDPKSDLVSIATETVEHLVRHPKQIHVDHEVDSLRSFEVLDAEGNHHIVQLKDALTLPAP